jgi:3-deoxy-D-manno-octulosonic-acid transferase
MLPAYNLGIGLYITAIRVSSLFNKKAALWVKGRKNIFSRMQAQLKPGEKRVWFHCASLGEFEQGRPVIEAFRKRYPSHRVVLTFFSPSGYEIRKNYPGADYIFYLPADTRRNAERFLSLVQPKKAFFIKYEFWYHYISGLHTRNIPAFVVSANFRRDQIFFRSYGGFFRHFLRKISFFFVQNTSSLNLLESIGVRNVLVSGDTRFDRVAQIASSALALPLVEKFRGNHPMLVAGSTWPKDEELLIGLIADIPGDDLRLIIAPHEIHESSIAALEASVQKLTGRRAVRYSALQGQDASSYSVLIIDNIGMLSALYGYADWAYIGGGFGRGIHNILEAAVFGAPVFFGPNCLKFAEAVELTALGGAFRITSSAEMRQILLNLTKDTERYKKILSCNKSYVQERTGATARIIERTAS